MGDWADFVESYGYDAGDSEALDKIQGRWADDEIKGDYKQDLEKGKNSPKKSYHNSKVTKFGFKNFKPFGKKIQSFSKKPITLIYGPNSIGKSSLIHMMAYENYMHKTKNLDLISTDMFGDNINLGGFSKFIHKRDKYNTLTLEYEYEDCSEAILDFLGIKYSISEDKRKALSLFPKEDILNIIDNSEQYTHNLITKDKGNHYKTEESILDARKVNKKCDFFYRDEFEFCDNLNADELIKNYFDFTEYIDSTGQVLSKFKSTSGALQCSSTIYTNGNGKFISESLKDKFISDTLIPYFINSGKLAYIKDNFILLRPNELLDNRIKKEIADSIHLKIQDEIENTLFYEKIKSEKIPLKISIDIEYIKALDKEKIVSVKYFVDNQLFDKLIYEDFYNGNGFEIASERESYDRSWGDDDSLYIQKPDIFENIPESILGKIYPFMIHDQYSTYQSSGKNRLHEKSDNILSLSFKHGYNKLIGVFNDMLGFDKMQYIGPLRFYPERDTSFKELDSDTSIIPDSQTSWSYLKKDKALRDTINVWLKDPSKLKTPYEIKYRELYDTVSIIEKTKDLNFDEIIDKYLNIYQENSGMDDIDDDTYLLDQNNYAKSKNKDLMFTAILKKLMKQSDSKEELVFEDLRNGTQISNRDLGLGISQILPILIATNHQKNTTIAVEQPELHLHPAVQCEIADEFIRSYKQNKNEFLIETHSEHLLLRIMKRMRWADEDKEDRDKSLDITHEDICLLYVDSNGESTYLNELELDADGSLLDPWPNGFFEEGHKERFD